MNNKRGLVGLCQNIYDMTGVRVSYETDKVYIDTKVVFRGEQAVCRKIILAMYILASEICDIRRETRRDKL